MPKSQKVIEQEAEQADPNLGMLDDAAIAAIRPDPAQVAVGIDQWCLDHHTAEGYVLLAGFEFCMRRAGLLAARPDVFDTEFQRYINETPS